MKIDLNKKYRYRNGEPARVLCVDAAGDFSVITIDQNGEPRTHTESGAYYNNGEECNLDLIEVREPLECWVKVEDDNTVDRYTPPETFKCGAKRRLFREVIE